MAEPRVAMVATPDDGSCGVGAYAGDLRAHLGAVEHVELRTNTRNPFHVAGVALAAGTTHADVVHVQHEYGLFGRMTLLWWVFGPLLWLTTRLRSRPVVLTLHEAWDDETAGLRARRLQLAYVRAVNASIAIVADHLLFLSETREAAYRNATPVEVGSTSRLPHGVEVGETIDLPPPAAKKRFGYDAETTLVVEPGYVSRQKGADVLVDVAERLPDREFLLAGGARTHGDEQLVSELRDRAPSNVAITGVLDHDAFHAAFRAADLVVLPYRKDGQSGVFNWCAAYGLPVAGSRCDYFTRLAAEWDCVALFDLDEPDDIEACVRRLLADGDERDRLANAMAAFRDANRFEHVAGEHRELYRSLWNPR